MKAKVIGAGHGLHAQLVVFPLGLLRMSPLWELLELSTDRPIWGVIAYRTIALGVIGAFVAAIPGLLDYRKISSGTRAERVGQRHMMLNLVIIGMRTPLSVACYPAGLRSVSPSSAAGWEEIWSRSSAWHDGANPNAARGTLRPRLATGAHDRTLGPWRSR